MIFSYTPIYVADSAEGSKFQFEFSDAIPIESDWETAVEKKTAKFEKKKKSHFWLHSYSAFTKQGLKSYFIFCFGLFEKLSSGTFFTARLPKTFSQKYKNVLNSTTQNKIFWLSLNSQTETLRILILLTFS